MKPSDSSNIKKIDADFHFFSDTELTANGNVDSRAGSPINIETVQSDSEFEVKFRKAGEQNEGAKSWEWGGFPSISQTTSPTGENPRQEEHKSMLSGMFSFMKQKHSAQSHLEGGIYLSEITSGHVDQDVAQIYFSNSRDKRDVDMDCESGNGPSLTQSPNSADGCKSIDSDFDDHSKLAQSYSQDISLSLCGWEPEPDRKKFLENVVKFSDLCNNPILFENPNLVVRIKDKYYSWKVAAPIIASIMIYGRPLVQSSVDQLCNMHMPTVPDAGTKEGPKQQEARYSWWSWRRGRISREDTPAPENATETNKTAETKDIIVKEVMEEVELKKAVVPALEGIPSATNIKDESNLSISPLSSGSDKCRKTLRSDVLGHILPIVGKDWAQSGVAQLFNKIKDNGYKLLYLSARAIGQARITREYLRSIKQGDLSMPDGPILLNPTSLITAFHREVIEKKPEQFKISCMSDIKALFPADSNPFYAGYGNRINDVWAYRAVGIPIVRIFTINPKGELKHELTQTFQSSYTVQSMVVNDVFPPLLDKINSNHIQNDYDDDSDSESSYIE
ncbi:hypothetical protein NQ314_012970 [Rhamnusium bicolor]|uniref:LNS2/PITP domain-containing protein n=1 Tax=Rhamnusium bicolor TaxID=1586634 RepID=A0AAV8X8Z5_9CUCU|nr:hypothetical protein NQ314_012970 [Rhamnusium bicolor]